MDLGKLKDDSEDKWIEYETARDAATKLNLQTPNISKVLHGHLKTTGGYIFKKKIVENKVEPGKDWETIKKENGLKLAEALEVELTEILDSGDLVTEVKNETTAAAEDESAVSELGPPPEMFAESSPWYTRPGHLVVLVIIFAAIGTAGGATLDAWVSNSDQITQAMNNS